MIFGRFLCFKFSQQLRYPFAKYISMQFIQIYHVVQGLWAFSLTRISLTDAQQSLVHLEKLLRMPVVRQCWHAYACKIYHVVQELLAFSLTSSGQTEGLTNCGTCNLCLKWWFHPPKSKPKCPCNNKSKLFVAVPVTCTRLGGFIAMWFDVWEHLKAQLALFLV